MLDQDCCPRFQELAPGSMLDQDLLSWSSQCCLHLLELDKTPELGSEMPSEDRAQGRSRNPPGLGEEQSLELLSSGGTCGFGKVLQEP